MAAGLIYCSHLEERYVHELAPEFSAPKLQGVALQEEAYEQNDLLVMYGSSELGQDLPANANEFFEGYPTGFRTFPVGKPGTTSLSILQKVAAVGDEVKGRKLACSISPGYFFCEVFDPTYYEGNFSELQALELVFTSRLSRDLKRDIARRMLEYPSTVADRWLLRSALESLASESAADRAFFTILQPAGKLQTLIGRAQDHVETALHILDQEEILDASPARSRKVLDWNALLRTAAKVAASPAAQARKNGFLKKKLPQGSQDVAFLRTIAKAREWTDFELLMRTFKELGALPLLLSMPIEDVRLEFSGLSPRAREAYVQRMQALAQRYSFPLVAFREHEKQPDFLLDFGDHLSAEGWTYYNKALDDFYHGRVSQL